MNHTGGIWDPTQWPIYFLASQMWTLRDASIGERDHLLIAVNEIKDNDIAELESLLDRNRRILLDSGVYWLATQHAEAHGLTMDQALSLAPAQVDNFDRLFERYVNLANQYQHRLWGYIEIDQGGRENKKRTRATLEAMGLRPIPVYHPLNDGWDYFDELAQTYDRICLGNVVMASPEDRKRLLATIWERRRKYPHLWIHALGMTPNNVTIAYMMNSFDSSSWLVGVRYGEVDVHQINTPFQRLIDGFTYTIGAPLDAENGHRKAWRLSGYNALMLGRSLFNIRRDLTTELGADAGMFD